MFKTNRFLSIIIKILVSVFAVVFLFSHFDKQSFSFESIFKLTAWQRLILIIFTLINWILEIAKWQFLASKVQKIDFNKAAKQSLISFSLSLLTPNRVGELGVKTLFFDKKNAKKIFSLSLIGTTTQMISSLIMGATGLIFTFIYLPEVIYHLQNKFALHFSSLQLSILGISFVLMLLIIVIYVKKKNTQLLISDVRVWGKSLAFALARYVVFATQFMLVYHFIRPESNFFIIYLAVSITYFIATLIPMLSFMDWAVKGSVALLVFGALQLDSSIATISVALMWILNFMLPFVIGIYLLWRWRLESVIPTKKRR